MVAMMLVVNYAKKIKTELPLLKPFRWLGSISQQRSAAQQHSRRQAAQLELIFACLCDAQQAHVLLLRWRCLPSLLVVQQRVERGCAPPPAAFPIRKQPAAQ